MDEGNANIGGTWIAARCCVIGPGEVGARQNFDAGFLPELFGGGDAIAHIQPEEEAACRPVEAEAVAEDALGTIDLRLIAFPVFLRVGIIVPAGGGSGDARDL